MLFTKISKLFYPEADLDQIDRSLQISEKLPDKYFSWMGGSQRLKNINRLGKLDFSNVEHIISSKNSIF